MATTTATTAQNPTEASLQAQLMDRNQVLEKELMEKVSELMTTKHK